MKKIDLRQFAVDVRRNPELRRIALVDATLVIIGAGMLFFSLFFALLSWVVSRAVYRRWLKKNYRGDVPQHLFWLDRIYDAVIVLLLLVNSVIHLLNWSTPETAPVIAWATVALVMLYALSTSINFYRYNKRDKHIKTHAASELFGGPRGRFVEGRWYRAAIMIGGIYSLYFVFLMAIAVPMLIATPNSGAMSVNGFVDLAAVYLGWLPLAVGFVRLLGKSFAIKTWHIGLYFGALALAMTAATLQTVWPEGIGYDLRVLFMLFPIMTTPFIYRYLQRRSRVRATFE